MAKGMSLHVGLNSVDPKHYQGWSGDLNACEADANDMAELAVSQTFTAKKLLTRKATRAAVMAGIAAAAKKLKAGDIFFLTYSGHGGQLPDQNDDEPDDRDETWCLFDGEVVDDELYAAWSKFAAGVRILVLSDSCHSGTVAKDLLLDVTRPVAAEGPVYRAMPRPVALSVYQKHKKFYDKILKDSRLAKAQASIKASVLLISGCQDNQLSEDGTFNGKFTGTLKDVWNGGLFKGSYVKFHRSIRSRMPREQTPNRFVTGASNAAFLAQQPFSVNPKSKQK